jgi:phosphoserine phosphatase RsbX
MEKLTAQLVDCGVAARVMEGESESGDEHLVQAFENGILLAVVDGLGHGSEAAEAARLAVHTLKEHAGESVLALARHCHSALQHSRGAVMSLACFNAVDSSMTWMGVGNVDGLLARADGGELPERESLLLRAGVVGGRLPPLRASVIPIAFGDVLVFATDGVAEGFYDELRIADSPQKIADRILETHGKGTDDAMVLVARFLAESL